MIADTHVHVWDFNRAEYAWLQNNTTLLNRSFSIEELEGERVELGITSGILVQAANNFEDTDWMLHVARHTPWIAGVVGWLPLMDPEATRAALDLKYGQESYFKGVRHLIHDEADAKWMLQPQVLESLSILAERGIPYDVVGVLPEHLQTALEVAEKLPGLRMVFDHLNQPPIAAAQRFGQWGELMQAAAGYPNLFAKISGLGTASGNFEHWDAAAIKPYIEFIINCFGEDRCFCGGDWPVALLAGSYSRVWTTYLQIIAELTDERVQHKIFYTNARQFYSF